MRFGSESDIARSVSKCGPVGKAVMEGRAGVGSLSVISPVGSKGGVNPRFLGWNRVGASGMFLVISETGDAMSVEQAPFWVGHEDGEAYWVLGGLYTYKALADQVGGDYTAIEVRAEVGMAIPVHYHDKETEAFYVADGAVTLLVGDDEVMAGPGSFIFVPPKIEHAFRFESNGTMLLLFTRGSAHEGLFREIGEAAPRREVPPPPDEFPDPEQMAEVAARFGTRIVGPPLA